jgi:hypothetical protein
MALPLGACSFLSQRASRLRTACMEGYRARGANGKPELARGCMRMMGSLYRCAQKHLHLWLESGATIGNVLKKMSNTTAAAHAAID